MLRQLLTLLAVFGGLAIAVEPAQALSASVESVALAEKAGSCQVPSQILALPHLAERSQRAEGRRDKFCTRPVMTIHAPTVMLQADRARE